MSGIACFWALRAVAAGSARGPLAGTARGRCWSRGSPPAPGALMVGLGVRPALTGRDV